MSAVVVGGWLYGAQKGRTDARRVLLGVQGRACATCDDTDPLMIGLKLDHCHHCGWIRGLLCHSCNGGLGVLDRDPAEWSNLTNSSLRTTPEIHDRRWEYARRPVADGCQCRRDFPGLTLMVSTADTAPLDRPYMTQGTAAEILGISLRTAGSMLARGEIDAVKVGNQWRIPTETFLIRFGLAPARSLTPETANRPQRFDL